MITVVTTPFLPRAPYGTADMPWAPFRAGWASGLVLTSTANALPWMPFEIHVLVPLTT